MKSCEKIHLFGENFVTINPNFTVFLARLAFAIITVAAATDSFKSKAYLNRDTGIVTSCEESLAVFSVASQKTTKEIADFAKGVIAEYPNFLAMPS
jgi:hypothetical protein